MRKLDLAVHIGTKLNRSHLPARRRTSLILPCLGRTEQDVQATGGPQAVTVEDLDVDGARLARRG